MTEFLKSFAKRERKLSDKKKYLIKHLLPKLQIDIDTPISLPNTTINFEIGFGKGDFLANVANRFSEEFFIGCDTYINGVAALLDKTNKQHSNNDVSQIKQYKELATTPIQFAEKRSDTVMSKNEKSYNVSIWPDDARVLLSKMDNSSIDNVFILFPDPWPKAKHNKRRIINSEFIKLLSDKTKDSGSVFFATDDSSYAEWTREYFGKNENFIENSAFTSESSKYLNNLHTRYQERAHKQNIVPHIMEFINNIAL